MSTNIIDLWLCSIVVKNTILEADINFYLYSSLLTAN